MDATQTDKTPQGITVQAIPHFVINLAIATERLAKIKQASERFGLDLHVIEAVEGKKLTEEQSALYDKALRSRLYPKDLMPNEIACGLSHIRALRAFVESGAPYGVILEDDAILTDKYDEKLVWLVEHVEGWGVIKLGSMLHPFKPITEAAGPHNLQIVLPKRIPNMAIAMLYKREAAAQLLKLMEPVWEPADTASGRILLGEGIPFCGCNPNLVDLPAPGGDSFIDQGGDRSYKHIRRTLLQYIRYRLHIARLSTWKSRMYEILKKAIRIK